jgi:hypothetical protein
MRNFSYGLLAGIFFLSLGSSNFVQAQSPGGGVGASQVEGSASGSVQGSGGSGAGGGSISGSGTLTVTAGAPVSSQLIANGPGGVLSGNMRLIYLYTAFGMDIYSWSCTINNVPSGTYQCNSYMAVTNPQTGQVSYFSNALGTATVP